MEEKIGIMTFHNAINYGAALQAFASQYFLNSNHVDCELIDYQCDKLKNDYKIIKVHEKSLKGIIKAVLRAPIVWDKQLKFKKFRKEYFKLSERSYGRHTIHDANKFYKAFIVGSDQVWNLKITGMDTTYLLDFVDSEKGRFSYAASMGNILLGVDSQRQFRKYASKFNFITVREYDAKDYLSDLLKRQVDVVLDPVFLLSAEEWGGLVETDSLEKYILVYCLHEDQVYTQAERIAKITGYKIICIQNSMKKTIKAKYILNAGPIEFIGLIKSAEYVVTDSFHGTAFGIIFRKQIKVILKSMRLDLNMRLITLLDKFGLSTAIVDKDSSDDVFMKPIEFDDNLIKEEIQSSRNILLEMTKETNYEK